MKTLVCAAALLCCILSSGAKATPEVIGNESETTTDKWTFKCIPDKKGEEADPTFRIHVNVLFQQPNWILKDLTVQFETYSGRMHDRGEQYNTDSSFFGRPEEGEGSNVLVWFWKGVKKDDPKHQMIGVIMNDKRDRKWHYNEWHEIAQKKGKPIVTEVNSTCHEVKKEEAN